MPRARVPRPGLFSSYTAMLSQLRTLLGAETTHVACLRDLRRGAIRASGILVCSSPLNSPIHRQECAGYLYQASHLGWRTVGPSSRKPLTRALVYASGLRLRLPSGEEVDLIARRQDAFEPEGHVRLAARDLPGFRASESLLATDEPVHIYGSAKPAPGGWTIRFSELRQRSKQQAESK